VVGRTLALDINDDGASGPNVPGIAGCRARSDVATPVRRGGRRLAAALRREPSGVNWLLVSVVASVVLTIVLNVALRAFRGSGDRVSRRFEHWTGGDGQRRPDGGREGRVRVVFPWKTAVIASLVLTVLLNVVIRLV
jgi:hypothetical protein